ncbi:phosphatidate cytidylyltransferase [bacterium]|nr:phosphatidate cytidylyltransferase [bacterium]
MSENLEQEIIEKDTEIQETPKQNKVRRVLTGWIVGVLCMAFIIMGGAPLLALVLVIICLMAKEYVKILQHKGFHPSLGVIIVAAIAFTSLIFFHRFDLLPVFTCAAIIGSFLIVLFKGRQPYIANVATTTLGIMYSAWLTSHVLLLRQIGMQGVGAFKISLNEGLFLLTFAFLAVIATDVGAYYFGSKFGKTKLAPEVSPKKSVEGAVFGALFCIFVCLFGVFYTKLTLLQCVIAGVLITVSAQLGDLSESLIKRDAGVKDSSHILPGHGGILDRADSYIFAAPVVYYYFVYFTHGNNLFFDLVNYLKGFINVYFG